jgi:hypothetical protein
VTITFKKNGTLAWHSEFACDATDQVEDHTGTWKAADDKIVLKGDKSFNGATLEEMACSDVPTAVCLYFDGPTGSFPMTPGDSRTY